MKLVTRTCGPLTELEYRAFHSLSYLFRSVLKGNFTKSATSEGLPCVASYSDVSQTTLINPGTGYPWSNDFPATIEEGFHNFVLSLLFDNTFHSVTKMSAPCDVTRNIQRWDYKPLWLATSYSISVILTFLAVIVGLHAILQNGYTAETYFSTFLSTTRNMELDRLMVGDSLGAWPPQAKLGHTRLRFGEIVYTQTPDTGDIYDTGAHASFGLPSGVKSLEKGRKYL